MVWLEKRHCSIVDTMLYGTIFVPQKKIYKTQRRELFTKCAMPLKLPKLLLSFAVQPTLCVSEIATNMEFHQNSDKFYVQLETEKPDEKVCLNRSVVMCQLRTYFVNYTEVVNEEMNAL